MTEILTASRTKLQPHLHLYPSLLDALRSMLSVIVIALFVLTFIVQPFRIPSESMEHTLLVGDFLLVNKAVYAPAGIWHWLIPYRNVQRGDIIVFHFPPDPAEHLVKRVIGLPGDHIHLHNGLVVVNGRPLPEPYAEYQSSYADQYRDEFPTLQYTDPGVDMQWWAQMRKEVQNGDLVIPPDSYFVLGDNRNHSRDSRYWGFVRRQNIVGRPFIIYFSLRQKPASTVPDLPDDRLGHGTGSAHGILGFARWNRIFRKVW
ncbi:MAG: signal peptidase I [Acidobacterium ailaaui]|nr:signal peptidase I [Pseudacidobacterium ailaaui]MCL6463752.1 signal peptidase I [Pseudacidobacterium ailaaui]